MARKLSTSKAVGLFLVSQELSDVGFIIDVVCELIKVKLSSVLSIFSIFLQVVVDLNFDVLTLKLNSPYRHRFYDIINQK